MLRLCTTSAFTQTKELLFNLVRPSQYTNSYVYHSPNLHVTFISSTDGLNIFDGINVRTYRQSTHNMYGYNIQSNFFEDNTGLVWFSTYEALHVFDAATNNFQYYFMVNNCKDTVRDNYKVFWKQDNLLYLKAGHQFFSFDITTKTIVDTFDLDVSDYFLLSHYQNAKYIDVLMGDSGGFRHCRFYAGGATNVIHDGKESITALLPKNDHEVWVGHRNGTLSTYDFIQKKFGDEIEISNRPVNGIARLSKDELYVIASSGMLFPFSEKERKRGDPISVKVALTRENPRYLIDLYLDQDSILWIGADGTGLLFKNLDKQKFQHWLNPQVCDEPISVTKILPLVDNYFMVLTRKFGIVKINSTGEIKQRWNKMPDGEIDFTTITGVMLDETNLLFTKNETFFLINLYSDQIVELKPDTTYNLNYIAQIDRLKDGKILVSAYDKHLFLFQRFGNSYSLKPYGNCQGISEGVTNFDEAPDSTLMVSNDEKDIFVLPYNQRTRMHQYAYSIPVAGGIRGVVFGKSADEIYFTNAQGLYVFNKNSHLAEQIKVKDNILSQTIYGVLKDRFDNLWLPTNQGIIKYYVENGETKKYTLMDGIQGYEFNGHSSFMTVDGSMLFGGVNGINYFHPDRVYPDTTTLPLYVSELLINDGVDTTLHFTQAKNYFELPFSKNTLTFNFHTIDYGDPEEARVIYELKGVDDHELELKPGTDGVRYANLAPGMYTLELKSKNSDGVIGTQGKQIGIRIIPPFWMTWWFITLSALALGVAIYALVKNYYRRKLEKQNQLLREQALIIEKQNAVEHERTRIASEMHDDIGAGLTQIRYLSDRALKHSRDQQEVYEIKDIADKSNNLVRNMSEIIWALNSRFDNTENLVGYLRRYASEFLTSQDIPYHIVSPDEDSPVMNITGEKRRDLFLVFKELLNNSVKYAQAQSIHIVMTVGVEFHVHIAEMGGKGFDPNTTEGSGNGIYNASMRMKRINGSLTFEKLPNSMDIHITAPLES